MAPRAAARLETLGFGQVYEYKPGKVDWVAAGLPAEGTDTVAPVVASVTRPVATFTLDDQAGTIAERLRADGEDWAAIVDEDGNLLGRVSLDDVDDPQATGADVMKGGPATYRPNVPLAELLTRMQDKGFAKAFVTDPDGKLLGLVTRDDIALALGTGPGIEPSSGGSLEEE